mmetsp:Transcript_44942/g.107438  ORF Transcript_44942/g.107438 Transcript_44942/m.107438 type:complete len:224 (+) Transcript_44942:1073-1744(+)
MPRTVPVHWQPWHLHPLFRPREGSVHNGSGRAPSGRVHRLLWRHTRQPQWSADLPLQEARRTTMHSCPDARDVQHSVLRRSFAFAHYAQPRARQKSPWTSAPSIHCQLPAHRRMPRCSRPGRGSQSLLPAAKPPAARFSVQALGRPQVDGLHLRATSPSASVAGPPWKAWAPAAPSKAHHRFHLLPESWPPPPGAARSRPGPAHASRRVQAAATSGPPPAAAS